MNKITYDGLDLEREKKEQSPDDWDFKVGAITSGIADKVAGIVTGLYAWPLPINGIYPRVMSQINHAIKMISEFAKTYLPIGMIQRGKSDWKTCASNAPHNELETQHNYAIAMGLFPDSLVAWFKEVGFINPENGLFEIDDVYTSIGSGTTQRGNSFRSPMEFIRNKGIIPKSMVPDSTGMSFNEYHNPNRITQVMIDMGKEYKKRMLINYDKPKLREFAEILGNLKWDIFDSYLDRGVAGDFIKRLAPDYNLMSYGYRMFINLNKDWNHDRPDSKKKMIELKREDGSKKVFAIFGSGKLWINSWDILELFIEMFGYKTLKEAQNSVTEVKKGYLENNYKYLGNLGNPSIWEYFIGRNNN